MAIPVALTIAGSDSGGGAGVQADLRVFTQLGVFGTSAITALTAQNTRGISEVFAIPAAQVESQIRAVLADFPVRAIKVGMLATAENVEVVAAALRQLREAGSVRTPARIPVVVDPVFVSSSGEALLSDIGIARFRETLVPLADLLTPNLPEAAILLNCEPAELEYDFAKSCQQLLRLGAGAMLLKGGHATKGDRSEDVVDGYFDGRYQELRASRVDTKNLHGTGCTFSAAIAAYLACGESLFGAATAAKQVVSAAIAGADQLELGDGYGPLNPWAINPERFRRG